MLFRHDAQLLVALWTASSFCSVSCVIFATILCHYFGLCNSVSFFFALIRRTCSLDRSFLLPWVFHLPHLDTSTEIRAIIHKKRGSRDSFSAFPQRHFSLQLPILLFCYMSPSTVKFILSDWCNDDERSSEDIVSNWKSILSKCPSFKLPYFNLNTIPLYWFWKSL